MNTRQLERQRESARATANEVRKARARLKERLAPEGFREGRIELASLIDHQQDYLQSETVYRLLQYPKHMGHRNARYIMAKLGLSDGYKLRDLTERQRLELCEELCEGRCVK